MAEQIPPIFGVIIPSRPLITNAQQVQPDRFLFAIDHAESLNHIVVFLTGTVPIPEGYGVSVHFLFPTKNTWQVLGMLSPTKPSAIFRLRGTAVPSPDSTFGGNAGFAVPTGGTLVAQLGLLVAPLSEVEQQCASIPSSSSTATSTALVPTNTSSQGNTVDAAETVRIAQAAGMNLFNYLSSFATSAPGVPGNWVEVGTVEKWWKTFEQKCRVSGGVGWLMNAS